MTKRLLVAVAALAAAACGGSDERPTDSNSLCNDLGPTATSLTAKAAPCSTTPISVTLPTPQQCTVALTAQCNAGDRTLLRTFIDCLNAIPACTTGNGGPFLSSINACTSPLSGLSATCASATGLGG